MSGTLVSAGILGFLTGLAVGLFPGVLARRRRRRQRELADFFENVRVDYYRRLGYPPPPRRGPRT